MFTYEDLAANYINKKLEKHEKEKIILPRINKYDKIILKRYERASEKMLHGDFYTIVTSKNKYKKTKSFIGTGIMCYKLNALEALKHELKDNEKIYKVHVEVKSKDLLRLDSYRDMQYIKLIYKKLKESNPNNEITDNVLMDIACSYNNRSIRAVYGIGAAGNRIHKTSSLVDYIGEVLLVKDGYRIEKIEEIH